MTQADNAAAEQIIRAQSIINDLTQQSTEIQKMMASQVDLINALTPFAQWGKGEIPVDSPPENEEEQD